MILGNFEVSQAEKGLDGREILYSAITIICVLISHLVRLLVIDSSRTNLRNDARFDTGAKVKDTAYVHQTDDVEYVHEGATDPAAKVKRTIILKTKEIVMRKRFLRCVLTLQ